MPFIRSLAVRLSLAFLFVAFTAVVLVALFVSRQTRREFDQFVVNRAQVALVQDLADYYTAAGGWQGLTLAPQPENMTDRRRSGWQITQAHATLLDENRVVIHSRVHPAGHRLPRSIPGRELPIVVDGATVGWLILDVPGKDRVLPGSPEADFLERMRRALFLGSIGAAGVAVTLGVILARTLTRPLRELTAATSALARGAFGQQVPVRSADELGQLAASFNRMSTDLARSTEQRRQMTADIAHDLRTPLSVIMGYAEALADDKIAGSSEVYTVLYNETRHLQHLIDDLRTLSLADSGELALHRATVAPRSLLERAVAAHLPLAQQKEITLNVEASAPLPNVSVDSERMSRVLGNLIANAIRHTPNGGTVTLSASAHAGTVSLHVLDSGEGIDPDDLPHVFDRFYRADTSRVQQAGESGLGLAIVKSLVAAHGGTIDVASKPGQGAEFTISLPAQTA